MRAQITNLTATVYRYSTAVYTKNNVKYSAVLVQPALKYGKQLGLIRDVNSA